MDIYETVYDAVSEKLHENDMELPIDREDYTRIVRKNPYELRMDEFSDLKELSRVNALYYRFLNRLPEPGAYELLKERARIFCFDKPNEFDYFVMSGVCRYDEFRKTRKTVTEPEDSDELRMICKKRRRQMYVNYYFGTIRNRFLEKVLFPMWEALPESFRKGIRKVFGRGDK